MILKREGENLIEYPKNKIPTKMKQRKKSLIISIYGDERVIFNIDEIQYNTSFSRFKKLEPKLFKKLLKVVYTLESIKITPEEMDKLIAISFEVFPKQDSELSPYEIYSKQVEKIASDKNFPRPNAETPQNVLWMKSVGCYIIENEFNEEEVYTFEHEDKFGFSEIYVNKLMEIAYLCGKKENEDILNQYIIGLKEFLMRAFEDILNEKL